MSEHIFCVADFLTEIKLLYTMQTKSRVINRIIYLFYYGKYDKS